MQRLQAAARKAGIEVMYTTIESLTLDGRDRSLDYKITGFHVPKGSWDGKVIDELAPQGDEIWLPKTSSSVFVSTHIDYILRNLGVKQLIPLPASSPINAWRARSAMPAISAIW